MRPARYRHSATRSFLAAWLLAPLATPAEEPPAPATPETLLLRFAAVYGARDPGVALPEGLRPLQERLEASLADWDLDEDLEELKEVFALTTLEEVARWQSRVPAVAGSVATKLSKAWRLELSSRLQTPGLVELEVLLYKDGALVSAPRVVSRLGDRAVVSSRSPDEGTFLFLFLEVSESPAP